MSHTFDLTIAQNLYDSSEKFPVEYQDAWQWLGYGRKNNALRSFLSNEFDEGTDFVVLLIKEQNSEASEGRPSSDYRLTVDCLKTFAMMAKTEAGKQVRRYFLQCEKSHKESAQTIALLESEIEKLKSLQQSNVSPRVNRSGMEREIQSIRCEMEQVKNSIGMEYPEEAKFVRDGMVKRMVAIVKKATRKLPPSFVSPGQLDLAIPTALPTSTRSKANGGK